MNNNLDKINEHERNNINEERNEKKRREFTNIIIDDEFKKLIISVAETAQDPNNMYYLSKQSTYESYHTELKKYFNKKYDKKPSQTDNLAFIILLTYPEKNINNFTSVKDLKLAFNNKEEDSDFKPFGFEVGEYDEHTCICNEPICNVHRFQNIYSGMVINIGSVCNLRYGLINKNDPTYKSNDKKIKEYKEKQREKVENKPEGFYENLRQEDKKSKVELKNIKKENKLMMEEDKLSKKTEKLINDELKRLNKKIPGSYLSKKCYFCKSDTIFKNTEKLLLCSKCCPSHQKQKKQRFINSIQNIRECTKCKHYFVNNKGIFVKLCDMCYKLKECVSCEKDFTGQNDLCLECEKVYNMKKCQLCPFNFIVSHKSNDLYCDECDKNLIKCIDCKRDILKNSRNNTRCYTCGIRFVDKITVNTCEYCDDEFEVKENEKWKTCCSDCYFDNRTLEKCHDCNDYFKKMKNENWRTRCGPCYYKNKNKNISVTC